MLGTHLHGLFDNPEVVDAFLGRLGIVRSDEDVSYLGLAEENLDRLAEALRENLDMAYLNALVGL